MGRRWPVSSRDSVLFEMPVASATLVRVIRRWVRTLLSRWPTASTAASMAGLNARSSLVAARSRVLRSWCSLHCVFPTNGNNRLARDRTSVPAWAHERTRRADHRRRRCRAVRSSGPCPCRSQGRRDRRRRSPRNAPPRTCTASFRVTAWSPVSFSSIGRTEVEAMAARSPSVQSPSRPERTRRFWALLANGQRIVARKILVTTGLRDELPDVPGLDDRWARDVLHCPYCHGHEVRDQQLGVIGGTPAPSATPRSSGSGPTTSSTSPHPTR